MDKIKIAVSEIAHEITKAGSFNRQKNRFTTPFGNGDGELPVEAGRYRLLWAPICPWAHRQIIALKLLGLEDVISIGTASPLRTEKGWEFSLDREGIDPVLKIRYLPEIYAETDPNYIGRATVPAVVDVKLRKVVNNDYFKLTNYWETAWKPLQKKYAPELYPQNLRKDIDELNDIIFDDVNNGVYKAGFAQSQEAYEKAYDILFKRLDWLEERLSGSRFLFGDYITDSDIRLYVTLARFDAAYYIIFKTNRNRLVDFPNLWGYARDLYQTPYFGDTTDFEAIKKGYQLGNVSDNPYQILAKGPDVSIWNLPHERESLSKDPNQRFLISGEESFRGISNHLKKRPKEIEAEINREGAFQRQRNRFDTSFGDGVGELKAEAGKYRLIWAKGCHWSNRASIVRELLGLENAISINLVGHSKENHKYGWEFVYNKSGRDPVLDVQFLSELYNNADPDYEGRCTVPALVDVKTKKVVNNDYHRLTNYFETAFKPFHKKGAPDLYPEELRSEIDKYNDWLFPNVNNGTYRMMFAQSIEAYEDAFHDFYNALDSIDERLNNHRFLFGDYVTDSDIRLFVTLARFDTHYYRNLGPIKKRIVDYKNIWAYARDLYVIPAFKNNTYFRDIAAPSGDRSSIFIDFNTRFADQIDYDGIWSAIQNRHELSKTPNDKFLYG